MRASSRASTRTTRGVLENFGPHSFPAFTEESNDLPVWMHNAGYETALVGKYVNSYTDAYVDHRVPPGWDDWQVMDSSPMEAYYNYSLNDNGTLVHYGNRPSDYSTSVLTHKAVNFIHRARHPFFLYFAPSRRICLRSRRPRTAASSRTSPPSTTLPSTSATSARSRGAAGTRTC